MELHLGTVVEISGGVDDGADAVIREAFREIALIHRLMSFYLEDSDISRLHRHGAYCPVNVDERTVQVIRAAQAVSRVSNGLFDVTVAPELVKTGLLPPPPSREEPAANACWRDIEVVSDNTVCFHRPLWIDLGGIAKGFAVDRAFARCVEGGITDCIVNAGGDIRVGEGTTASVTLNAPGAAASSTGVVELSGGSIASSCADLEGRELADIATGPHFHGRTRHVVDSGCFVSVLANECLIADALTKVVLAAGAAAQPVLSHYAATALMHDSTAGWTQVP